MKQLEPIKMLSYSASRAVALCPDPEDDEPIGTGPGSEEIEP